MSRCMTEWSNKQNHLRDKPVGLVTVRLYIYNKNYAFNERDHCSSDVYCEHANCIESDDIGTVQNKLKPFNKNNF